MTCCRAQHPEELVEQLGYLREVAAETGDDASRLVISYQVTLNIGDSERRGARRVRRLHHAATTRSCRRRWTSRTGARSARPSRSSTWFRTFAAAGVDHFICRFGSLDQFGQVERFAREVLPALRAEARSDRAGG